MGNYTREEVMQMAEDEDVEFIRLQFTDMFGALKNIAVTARELPRALNNEFVVDSSFIAGITGESEPDMYLCPDPNTFAILPWRPQQAKVGRLLCDICRPDGSDYTSSCRYILKKTALEAERDGYTCYVDPECEFFLFHTDDNGMPTTLSHEKGGYLDISPLDLGENARRDMVLSLEDLGIQVESSHHETAPAQHEIDFHCDEIRRMADQIMTFKMAVRTVAKRHGLHATFMPKPRKEVNGSGMHLNFSLFKNGKNIFVDPEDPEKFSEDAWCFIGGLLEHSREMALVTNPLVNSYKRLVPGYEAPTELTWSTGRQESIIRLQRVCGANTRIEFRSPDASANPYIVLALCLAAGMDGIRRRIKPAGPADGALESYPENLMEAIRVFEESPWIPQILGGDFCQEYVAAKKREWHRYSKDVSEWEVNEYLYRI
ncbi:MAG: glutamine synthetase family protein [Clostridiales bacterium]|nr:glutamine synthetase family protein [Clostridiales bacterium]